MSHIEAGLPTPRAPRTTSRKLAAALLFALVTCNQQAPAPEGSVSGRQRLAPVPPDEVATWKRIVSLTRPEGRFLQAVAFDEARKVVVMFGGEKRPPVAGPATPMQDLWEWSPVTGAWTLRPASGVVPEARAGAAMVFDPVRSKMLLFGGRSANTNADDYGDLWEWDPTGGTWTKRNATGNRPSMRTQHGMVFEASSGKVLLFGGGRSVPDYEGTGVGSSLGDTWELDPATGAWTQLAPASSPSMRHAFGLVWDSARSKAVLFGGMQLDIPGSNGVPKQDTWEWDPGAKTWTERTAAGAKPSARYGHATAFDGSRNKVIVFGGWDMSSSGTNDLWDWNATTGAWTQVLTGAEAGLPARRSFASMVFDADRSRLQIVAGLVPYYSESVGVYYGFVGSSEVWELEPATARFTDRSTGDPVPDPRSSHAMAYNPATGKTYVFGGTDPMMSANEFADLWEWDGARWSKVATETSPSVRSSAAMAYDPARKNLIMFGGTSSSGRVTPNDTWEWSSATRQWTPMKIKDSPAPRLAHAMVTDTTRGKILMFGGSVSTPEGSAELWEWDGTSQTWADRSPASSSPAPAGRKYPAVSFDGGLGKLIVYEGNVPDSSQSNSSYWEWDVVTGGWTFHDLSDQLAESANVYAVYDSTRRRHVFFTDVEENALGQTWELDATSAEWTVRSLAVSPGPRARSAMAYDSGRRVVVLFGGGLGAGLGGAANSDTWEFRVTNLANGEGCTSASAASCASGNCVDGVCCESATCSGACMSCRVPASEGTCVLAQAGTEVPGSCADGQACDGTGSCKTKNGQVCSAASSCASSHCVDGVCCDSECDGRCRVCNLPGHVGTCIAQANGTDPDAECGHGSGVCKSTCDGVGACTFPIVSCGACLNCDGAGTCSRPDPSCPGGRGGSASNTGGMSGAGGAVGGATDSGGSAGSGDSGGSGGRGGGGGGAGTDGSAGSGGVRGSGGGGGGGGSAGGGGSVGNGGSVGSGGNGPGDSGGTTGSAGSGGTFVSVSGGSSGTTREDAGRGGDGNPAQDGAMIRRDGGGDADAGFRPSLKSGGCSCEVGRHHDASSFWWLLLVATTLLVRCSRPRRWGCKQEILACRRSTHDV
jgi:hypothetical protein